MEELKELKAFKKRLDNLPRSLKGHRKIPDDLKKEIIYYAHYSNFTVSHICDALEITMSSYCFWRQKFNLPKRKQISSQTLKNKFKELKIEKAPTNELSQKITLSGPYGISITGSVNEIAMLLKKLGS